jgi:hypothetical protein
MPSLPNNDRLCGLVVRVPGYRSRGPRFDSQHYQILWEVVGLLSLVSTIQELLGRNVESQEYGRRDPLCWLRDTLYPRKLALTSPTSGGHSVGIVRSQNKATEFVVFVYYYQMTRLSETDHERSNHFPMFTHTVITCLLNVFIYLKSLHWVI